jgi:hypothetical protein
MKYFIEALVSATVLLTFLWQIAKGYQDIYNAIDQRDDKLNARIFELEKQFEIHEVECAESLKRIELLLTRISSLPSRYPLQ